MDTNTLGLLSALLMAWARLWVVLTRLLKTFCLKPGVQRLVASSRFCPAKFTTAVTPVGKPDSCTSNYNR